MRRNKVIFIKNALILTVTGLLIRFIGMLFRIWLASAVGAEGIGLYSQVFSFYMLASAFASTGINTAVTRLVSEELARGNPKGVSFILSRCIAVTLIIAGLSICVIYFGADFIAGTIVDDPRAAPSLKTLTFSLPFMGISSCFKGYFIARKRTAPASSSQIFEQMVRIFLVVFLVSRTAKDGIAASCRAVIMGDVAAEACSFLYIYLAYVLDKKRQKVEEGHRPDYSVLSKLRHIALPITVGRYLNSLLRTAENVLVPRRLEKFGMNGGDALSIFGVIKGMALPLIFFPASFLNALSTLLIPEMSEAAASGKHYKVKFTAEKCIHITLISSIPLSVIFFYTAVPLGNIVYSDLSAGKVIHMLAPIVPLMYMDSVCDGLLKGLDEQFSVFRNSMLDSIIRIALIILVLPRFGFEGFIGIMYLSNTLTCSLNLFRLKKVSKAEVKWFWWFVFPAVTALLLGTVFSLILAPLNLSDLLYTIIFSLSTALFYLFFVFKFGCITIDDLK